MGFLIPSVCAPNPLAGQEDLLYADLIPSGLRGSAFLVLGPQILCGHLREPERWKIQGVERRESHPGLSAWDRGPELPEAVWAMSVVFGSPKARLPVQAASPG